MTQAQRLDWDLQGDGGFVSCTIISTSSATTIAIAMTIVMVTVVMMFAGDEGFDGDDDI